MEQIRTHLLDMGGMRTGWMSARCVSLEFRACRQCFRFLQPSSTAGRTCGPQLGEALDALRLDATSGHWIPYVRTTLQVSMTEKKMQNALKADASIWSFVALCTSGSSREAPAFSTNMGGSFVAIAMGARACEGSWSLRVEMQPASIRTECQALHAKFRMGKTPCPEANCLYHLHGNLGTDLQIGVQDARACRNGGAEVPGLGKMPCTEGPEMSMSDTSGRQDKV